MHVFRLSDTSPRFPSGGRMLLYAASNMFCLAADRYEWAGIVKAWENFTCTLAQPFFSLRTTSRLAPATVQRQGVRRGLKNILVIRTVYRDFGFYPTEQRDTSSLSARSKFIRPCLAHARLRKMERFLLARRLEARSMIPGDQFESLPLEE